ncbi:MAG: DUF3794 domain-containing protein [Clostridia bacterium]|nr:DUF3794 domain-containing protein [Clostridia bacterium]
MQIKKQEINVGKAIFEGEIKSGAEGSIIVPDVKPDILKVLQVDAETFLTEKTIDNGKLILKGQVCVNVLYVPETEGERVQCIKGCFEFCETIKRAEFEQGMEVTAFCDASKIGYKLINSRKIGIESQVIINVSVTARERASFVAGIESESCEIKVDNICIKEASDNKEITFKIDETVDLPCADAVEILKSNVTIFEKDYRSITGKIILKGKVCVSILYVTEQGCYEHFDFEVPFTEVVDYEDIEEECICDVIYEILETEFKLTDSVNENKKSVCVNIKVQANISTEKCANAECIKDCYFTDAECEFEYSDLECEEVMGRPMFSAVAKHIVEKSENLPEISKIYTSVAKPYITSTDIQNGKIAVSGRITTCILYISDDEKCPISGMTEEVPFSYMIDCPEASRDTDVLLSIECEHISCTLKSSSSVEIRCGVGIKGKVIKKCKVKVINNISAKEIEKQDRAMVIYFVKSEDALWSVGKDYHVKCKDICDCNKLGDGEELLAGQKIVIPVSK